MDKIRALVKDETEKLESILSGAITEDNTVYAELKKFICGKSKRIRSILCILYLKAQNKELNEDIFNLLAACELIHNASLLHDDVIDESEFRRGEQAFCRKISPKASILTGDYLLSIAIEILIKLNNNKILTLFLNAAKDMSNAEIIQYTKNNTPTTPDEYLNIIKGKTASLFAALLSGAAIISGADEKLAYKIGTVFGTIFQINNDMNPESQVNDKKNGVQTAVNILGIEKTKTLKDNYKQEMREYLNQFPDNMYKNGITDLTEKL